MIRTKIKVCGVLDKGFLTRAALAGVDAIGLMFYKNSRRYLNLYKAKSICRDLPPFVSIVAVFVNPSIEQVKKTIKEIPVSLLQFHGDESAEFCRQFNLPYIKACAIKHERSYSEAERGYPDAVAILADSFSVTEHGGTGETFNWHLIPSSRTKPLILAGGLNSDNVTSAIKRTSPFCVDISGGLEGGCGNKDEKKLSTFVKAVNQCEQV